MRKAGLKCKLNYETGYQCGLSYCLYLIGKDYQPTVIIDYLKNKIRGIEEERDKLIKSIGCEQ